jgi:hypothetical protein
MTMKTRIRTMSTLCLLTIAMTSPGVAPSSAAGTSSPVDLSASQWHLPSMGVDATTLAVRTDSTVVAVVSDGIDKTHPEFQGHLVAGWDATTDTSYTGESFETLARRPIGTVASGLISASADRSGVSGVSPGVRIMPVRVESDWRSGDRFVASGIDWSVMHGADIIAFVPGRSTTDLSEPATSTCAAITRAKRAGVPVFVPAAYDLLRPEGSGSPFRPALCRDAVVVAGVDDELGHVVGAPNIARPSFAVPSHNLLSTAPFERTNAFVNVDGVNFAPALAAGAAAVVRTATPALDVDGLIALLQLHAVDVGPAGSDDRTGAGIIDVAAAAGFRPARTADQLLAVASALAAPRIVRIEQTAPTKVSVVWDPANGFAADTHRISWGTPGGATREFTAAGNDVRATLPITLDQMAWLTVTAVGPAGSRVSAPSRSSMLLGGSVGQSAGSPFREVRATWVADGIKITMSPMTPSMNGAWTATVRDAVTGKVLARTPAVAGTSTTLKIAPGDQRRGLPTSIWAGNGTGGVSTLLEPAHLLSAKVIGAGASYIVVKGSAENACRKGVATGCPGAKIKVVDRNSGKTLGSTFVLDDYSYSVTVRWTSSSMNLEVQGPVRLRAVPLTGKIPGRR